MTIERGSCGHGWHFYSAHADKVTPYWTKSLTTRREQKLGIKGFFFRRAMRMIAARIAPDQIPMSRPRVLERNYFSATLTRGCGLPEALVDGVSADGILARAWNNLTHEYREHVLIPFALAEHAESEVIYYVRQYEFQSTSPIRLLFGVGLGTYQLRAWWGDFYQGFLNRRTLESRRRMELLQDLMAWSIEHPREFASAPLLLAARYGTRVIFHPSYRSQVAYTDFLLQSLVAEQLACANPEMHRSYRIDPRGFAALDAFNTEERRHKDSGRVQRILAFIGLLALLASFAQAAAGVKQAWFSDTPSVATPARTCLPASKSSTAP